MANDSDSSMKSETELNANPSKPSKKRPSAAPKGLRFWLVFVAICVSLFLSALEYVSVPIVAPSMLFIQRLDIADRRRDNPPYHRARPEWRKHCLDRHRVRTCRDRTLACLWRPGRGTHTPSPSITNATCVIHKTLILAMLLRYSDAASQCSVHSPCSPWAVPSVAPRRA